MTETAIIGFAAYSGVGKTTLIEKLVRRLKEKGLRVAVVKHDGHAFSIDREGKDSWRYTRAGADVSVISSADQTALVERRNLDFAQVVSRVRDVDLILVEGYKDNGTFPQIGLSRAAAGKGFPHDVSRYAAVVTDEDIPCSCPKFGLDDIEEMVEFMLKNREDFTHFNDQGRARMVNVAQKPESCRTAVAAARVQVNRETFDLIRSGGMKKGDVLTVAQIAGVMGAKRTPDLIPMCHPILLDGVDLDLQLNAEDLCVEIRASVTCGGKTGVEMEALTAASTAALTVYDMCKAVQRDMVIRDIRLLEKTGGIHGDYHRKEEEE